MMDNRVATTEADKMAEFGSLMSGLRRARGLTQEALAWRSGISVRTIRNLEAGRVARPRSVSITLLASALELSGSQRARFEMKAWPTAAATSANWVLDDRSPLPAEPPERPVLSATPADDSGPHPLTESLVGREADLAYVLRVVRERPLLTLIGPGGVGKSRLAITVASQLAGGYPDDVTVVQLGHVTPDAGPGDVARVILARLGRSGLDSQGEWSLAALARELSGRRVLLVIDTAEHVADAVREVAGHLLMTCPSLRMIVTTRRSLSVPGDCVWEVLPLPAVPAARLFTRRAAEQCPGLDLAGKDDVVSSLCLRLDGLPQAIESAVGWLRSMSPATLASRLSPGMLVQPGTTALAHQSRLTTSVAWSLNLLTPEQRLLLANLARLPETFDSEAVGQLAATGKLPGVDVDAEFAALVGDSLVQVFRGDRYRYRILSLTRDCLRQEA
jgi:predicted ATPase/transcriptional regulator with XRE-family HTH domain